MKKTIAAIATLLGLSASPAPAGNFTLDYDQMITLDAEDLAEAGIKNAYEKLCAILKTYVSEPAAIAEKINNDLPSYSIIYAGDTYDIYSPTLSDAQGASWGRATYMLFMLINNQLRSSAVKFYAINGGNDLGGMFLTEQQAATARKNLTNKTDWPYLPTPEHPWYGQHH